METTEIIRAYRVALDPTDEQLGGFAKHAGASRWAFNHALAAKVESHRLWQEAVDLLVEDGTPVAEARKAVKVPIPQKSTIQKALNAVKGDSRTGADGPCPWWWEVSTYAIQSGMTDADMAWKAWLDSFTGRRRGRRVGYPRFKRKGRSRDSFRLYHNANATTKSIRPATSRRLLVPRLGEIRTHDSLKRVIRAIKKREGVIKCVTISRGGHRWYASILMIEQVHIPTGPNRRQRANGAVGVSVGIADHKIVLSTGETIINPRIKDRHAKAVAKANRALSRTGWRTDDEGRRRPSGRRQKARRYLAKLHHLEAERRATHTHTVTKRLVTQYAGAVLEDLDIIALTASARGSRRKPGRAVKAKTKVNRATLDIEPGELRRQITYKSGWYGSEPSVVAPIGRTTCRIHGAKTTPTEDATCECGLIASSDIARQLAEKAAAVAPDGGDT